MPRVAVMIVGALRTFTDAMVQESIQLDVLDVLAPQSDVFYYLFVGEELSNRGQRAADATPDARTLERLMELTKGRMKARGGRFAEAHVEVRVQYEENSFI